MVKLLDQVLIMLKKVVNKMEKDQKPPKVNIKGFFKKINDKYQHLPNKKKKALQGYLYILPWIIGLAIFGVYQICSSFRISMASSAKYIADATTGTVNFVTKGFEFKQYIAIFKDNPSHVEIIFNTIKDIGIVVPLVIIFSLLLALLLKRKIKGISIFRTIFFIPVILLSGNMLSYFSQYGLLTMPGIDSGKIAEEINFYFSGILSDVILGAFAKIILILWLSGVQTLVFLVGLQKIDSGIYEAASIDGASGWDIFWKITLPSLFPLMIVNIIYTTVIYANLSNNSLVHLISDCLTDPKFGRAYSSALAWILFIIELLIIGVYVLLIKLSSRKYKVR